MSSKNGQVDIIIVESCPIDCSKRLFLSSCDQIFVNPSYISRLGIKAWMNSETGQFGPLIILMFRSLLKSPIFDLVIRIAPSFLKLIYK